MAVGAVFDIELWRNKFDIFMANNFSTGCRRGSPTADDHVTVTYQMCNHLEVSGTASARTAHRCKKAGNTRKSKLFPNRYIFVACRIVARCFALLHEA